MSLSDLYDEMSDDELVLQLAKLKTRETIVRGLLVARGISPDLSSPSSSSSDVTAPNAGVGSRRMR